MAPSRIFEGNPNVPAPPAPELPAPDPWQAAMLDAIGELASAVLEKPAPTVEAPQVDLSALIQAVQGLNGPATADEIAAAIARQLRPAEPVEDGTAATLGEVAEALKALEFRMRGVGTQAYGGGSVSFTPQGLAQLTEALTTTPLDVNVTNAEINVEVGPSVEIANDTGNPVPISGAVADGAAVSGNPVLMAGQDGTNVQSVRTDTTGNQGVYQKTIATAVGDTQTNSPSILLNEAGNAAIYQLMYGYVFNGATWDRLRGTTAGLDVGRLHASATNTGLTTKSDTALSNTAVAIKASSGRVYGYSLFNPSIATVFIQFFNVAAASVTVGTTTPLFVVAVPAGGAVNVLAALPITFSAAFSMAATTTATGSTAPATAAVAAVFYA